MSYWRAPSWLEGTCQLWSQPPRKVGAGVGVYGGAPGRLGDHPAVQVQVDQLPDAKEQELEAGRQ